VILIVKGSREVALAEAAKRDIAVSDNVEETSMGDTMLFALDPDMMDIMAWYNEPPMSAPFPEGALLFYNEEPRFKGR
jgi:hypothetical protein